MNIPNFLTILRMFSTIILIVLFPYDIIAAGMIFAIAAVTDYFDGFLARKYDLVTPFGKIMDPIADKFLILTAFLLFVFIGMVPWWMFWMITVREVAVTLFRFYAMAKGKVLAAEQVGKVKTVLQIAAVAAMFVFRAVYDVQGDAMYEMSFSLFLGAGTLVLLWMAVIITLISGISVFWNNRAIFCQGDGGPRMENG